jgi:hypothetical protein
MLRSIGSVTFLALLMVACGGGGSGGGDSSSPPPPPATYTVGGTVSGLAGAGLVLRDNGGDDLAEAADGAILFPTKIASGATYSVTVLTQPTSPAQTCAVTHGSGTMGSSDVTNVAVSCTFNRFTGFVSGPYFYSDITALDAHSGPVVYDGVGGYSGSYVLNSAGVISSGSISGSYTAAAGGALTVHGYSGAVSADGNTILSAKDDSYASSFDVEIKQGQTNFTNADFSGIYQVVSVSSQQYDDSGGSLTLTADGAGSYSGTLVQKNDAGVITSSAVSGTYSVAPEGALTITPASGSPLSGGISADAKTLVLSQVTAGQPSAFAVGIKQGQTNFTNADVVGTYTTVTYLASSAELATLNFDGAGNVSGTKTGTYTVAADGTLTVYFISSSCSEHGCGRLTFTGGVSSDGNTLVLQLGGSANACVGIRL